MVHNLEIIPIFFSTRRSRNLVRNVPGFSWTLKFVPTYCLVLIVNRMGRILVRWQSFRKNLKILRHLLCKWLYCGLMNESCHTYGQVLSHMHASCHTCMRHVTHAHIFIGYLYTSFVICIRLFYGSHFIFVDLFWHVGAPLHTHTYTRMHASCHTCNIHMTHMTWGSCVRHSCVRHVTYHTHNMRLMCEALMCSH